MKEDNGYGGAGWFLVGGLAGACAALLLAPAAGKTTRQRLTRRMRETRDSVTNLSNDLAHTTLDRARSMGKKAAQLAGEASATAHGVSAAAHEALVSLGNHAER